jgi:hypothetical protein
MNYAGYNLAAAANPVTRLEFLVSNCRFVQASVATTPIQQQGGQLPTYTVLTNNTYNTTNLISYATNVTNTSPVQTL